jgi:hypothetical protein
MWARISKMVPEPDIPISQTFGVGSFTPQSVVYSTCNPFPMGDISIFKIDIPYSSILDFSREL